MSFGTHTYGNGKQENITDIVTRAIKRSRQIRRNVCRMFGLEWQEYKELEGHVRKRNKEERVYEEPKIPQQQVNNKPKRSPMPTPVVKECEGCLRAKSNNRCEIYERPKLQWRNGQCSMQKLKEIKREEAKKKIV